MDLKGHFSDWRYTLATTRNYIPENPFYYLLGYGENGKLLWEL